MNLPLIERLVDRHLAAYCDPDATRRIAAVREVWNADGSLVDPPLQARGHQGIADQAATLLSQFPQHRFERSTAIDAHHQFVRYGWRLLDANGAGVLEGVDFAELDVDGKLLRVVGFFGAQPAAAA
ncbi:MAG: hypothetical protein JWQ76_5341 [Ramlibacter sp.]|nr:hypothetical protein [Ramlibacter sp.]